MSDMRCNIHRVSTRVVLREIDVFVSAAHMSITKCSSRLLYLCLKDFEGPVVADLALH